MICLLWIKITDRLNWHFQKKNFIENFLEMHFIKVKLDSVFDESALKM